MYYRGLRDPTRSWWRNGAGAALLGGTLFASLVSARQPPETKGVLQAATPPTSSCGGVPASPMPFYLYLLIDASPTANTDDPNGDIRKGIARGVLGFIAAYSHLANAPLFTYIDQYPGTKGEPMQNLWPDGSGITSPLVSQDTYDRAFKSLGLLNDTPYVDRPDIVMRDIRGWVDDPRNSARRLSDRKNMLVVLITQGSPLEAAAITLESRLTDTRNAWGTVAPVGVLLFGIDRNSLQDAWRDHFFEGGVADTYLDTIPASADLATRLAWEWGWQVFDKQNRFSDSGVSWGMIEPARQESQLQFQGPLDCIVAVTLQTSREEFNLHQADNGTLPHSDIATIGGGAQLRRWKTSLSGRSELVFRSTIASGFATHFLYIYSLTPTPLPTGIPRTTPSPTESVPKPTASPTATEVPGGQRSTLPPSAIQAYLGGLALSVLIVVGALVYFSRKPNREDTRVRMARLFLFLDAACSIIIVRLLVSEVRWDIFEALGNLLVSAFIGSGAWFIRNRQRLEGWALWVVFVLVVIFPLAAIAAIYRWFALPSELPGLR